MVWECSKANCWQVGKEDRNMEIRRFRKRMRMTNDESLRRSESGYKKSRCIG